jgi:hypothetical protein
MTLRGPYYAKDGAVWKHPVKTDQPGGGMTISLGFPICRMHEAVGADAAEAVSVLMNIGDAGKVTEDALESAAHALDALDPRGGKLTHPPVTEVIDAALTAVHTALVKLAATRGEKRSPADCYAAQAFGELTREPTDGR